MVRTPIIQIIDHQFIWRPPKEYQAVAVLVFHKAFAFLGYVPFFALVELEVLIDLWVLVVY